MSDDSTYAPGYTPPRMSKAGYAERADGRCEYLLPMPGQADPPEPPQGRMVGAQRNDSAPHVGERAFRVDDTVPAQPATTEVEPESFDYGAAIAAKVGGQAQPTATPPTTKPEVEPETFDYSSAIDAKVRGQ